ncbi:helix-turn-helix domain-containing protein [Streptomyces sp. NPDC000151]|uniref:PucR family transcriptional regulator n=1 Tax=Streptomyces sp. NPDC000151 TaxID=3154244 RepID=UPI00333413FA
MTELPDWVESQLPRLIDDVLAGILKEIDFYREEEVVSRADLQRSVEQNMRSMVAALREPDHLHDLSTAERTGRQRARQGAPLPELLRAYRMGFGALWELLTEWSRGTSDREAVDTVLSAATRVWQLSDEYAIALTEAYRSTTAELLVERQQRRSALVEALFAGEPGPDAPPWEVPKLLGLPSDTDHIVITAETLGPADPSLPGIEGRLAERGIPSAWQLTSAAQMGVVSLRPEQFRQVIELVRESASARTGVSPVFRAWRETPRALRLACAALHRLPEGRAEVNVLGPGPLAGLVARDPDEGHRVARQVLGPVLGLPSEERAVLLGTLQAWLDHDGSAERAAERLYVHANTVRYRLRRLQELTGRSLTQPRAIADLVVAMEAVRSDRAG